MPIRVPAQSTILLLLLWTMLITLVASDCPTLCECKWKNGKESVRCHNANLTEIPALLDAGTQVLDLQRNEISRLDGDEFSIVNLLNLQKIYLIDCQLTQLHRFAFRNLINLVELDLSDNRLNAVPSHVFESMAELRELRLSGNPLQRLGNLAFDGLTHLVRLELSNCRIRRIEVRAFEGVRRSLEWLKLDGNELINVQPDALTILNNLHGIELTRNNWNCTCTLRPLREWMVKQNIPYEFSPICAYPERLKDRPWSRMDIDEFACAPLLVARSTVATKRAPSSTHVTSTVTTTTTVTVKAIEGQNVTIGCDILTGNPDPTIRWMFRNRVIVSNVSLRTTSGTTTSIASSSFSTTSSQSSNNVASQQQPPPPDIGNNIQSNGSGGRGSSVAAMTTLDTRKKFYHHLGRTTTNVTIAWIDNHDSGVYKCIAENGAGRSEATISVLVYSRHYLIDSNNNVIEASVALSNNRFIFIISTIVAILFVIFSLLLAICYYTVHRKNTRATAAIANVHRQHHRHTEGMLGLGGGGVGGGRGDCESGHGVGSRKKVLNKKSFSFLLCQNRSESYEKIEMTATTNPLTTSGVVGGHGCDVVVANDELLTSRTYSARGEREDDVDEDRDVMRGFPKLSPGSSKFVQDKRRRTMSLNLSSSPKQAMASQQQRKKVALSCRRNGDYSNVPTAEDDCSSGHDKLMVTGGGRGGVDRESDEKWKLFTKHQAQSDDVSPENRPDQQWLNGPTTTGFLPNGERRIAPTTVSASHQKVNSRSRSNNIHLSTISGNFSHPLADQLSKTTAKATNGSSSMAPLINIDTETNNLDLIQPSEVIRHHVMRKRLLTEECSPQHGAGDLNKSKGIVIYTTTTNAEARTSPESLTAADSPPPQPSTTIIGHQDRFNEAFEAEDKLGRLSPTLNSIIRNDENFDLFDVRSNLDDFYVKQLNYDYHQLQQTQNTQQHMMLANNGFGGAGAGGRSSKGNVGGGIGKQIPNQNYFCSLPRKRSYESKKNLMGFTMTTMTDGFGEELFDAPLEDSLFRQHHRQKSSSELNLMTSMDVATANDLAFISSACHSSGTQLRSTLLASHEDEGENNGRQGTIIKPLSDNNKATPLLNFPTTSQTQSSAVTTASKVTATGATIGMASGGGGGSGIFPGNCASPSIMMCSGPLASSILSPTNVSAASSSSPSSSSVSSVAKKSSGGNGSVKGVGGDYDYHAAQLEMFLDEYKRLQLQLCKMKETCDSIRRTEMRYGNYNSSPAGTSSSSLLLEHEGASAKQYSERITGRNKPPVMAPSISSALLAGNNSNDPFGGRTLSSYDPYQPMNKLLEKSNILLSNDPPQPAKTMPKSLAFGNKHKSYSGSTPEPPPYWLHRNELLKGIQKQQQQQQSQLSAPMKSQYTPLSGLGTTHNSRPGSSSNPESGVANSSSSSTSS